MVKNKVIADFVGPDSSRVKSTAVRGVKDGHMTNFSNKRGGSRVKSSLSQHTREPRLLAPVTRLQLLCSPHHFSTSPWCTAASPCRNQTTCRPVFFVFHLYCLCSLWRSKRGRATAFSNPTGISAGFPVGGRLLWVGLVQGDSPLISQMIMCDKSDKERANFSCAFSPWCLSGSACDCHSYLIFQEVGLCSLDREA